MTALISELGVEDCDEYTMINEIERWTCERLSTRKSPYTQNKEESAPAGTNIRAPAIKDDPEAADSLLPKEEARNVPPQSVSFDTSMFSGMNRAISLSDI